MNGKKTSIAVSVETKDRLVKLGRKNETYDDIIRRLLDQQIPQKVNKERR